MTSLSIFCQVTMVPDATVDKIISCSTPQESNRQILDELIEITANDGSLTKFCNAIENIVGSKSPIVELLKSGKSICTWLHTYIRTYIHTHLCTVCTYNHVYVHTYAPYVCIYKLLCNKLCTIVCKHFVIKKTLWMIKCMKLHYFHIYF